MNAFAKCASKVGYPDKETAKKMIAQKRKKWGGVGGKRKHLYTCPLCGRIHEGRNR